MFSYFLPVNCVVDTHRSCAAGGGTYTLKRKFLVSVAESDSIYENLQQKVA